MLQALQRILQSVILVFKLADLFVFVLDYARHLLKLA
jgi:hypothetical protein